ncbi:hypothetical protein D3C87_2085200 [compost metagenome]
MKKPETKPADNADEDAALQDQGAHQSGGDYNDARWLHPSDPDFAGQGLDLSVYGKDAIAKTSE